MNSIAIIYGNREITYSIIILAMAFAAAFFIAVATYLPTNKNKWPIFIYIPMALMASIYSARIIHWYCNMENYDSFSSALSNLSIGDYCISGLLIGLVLPALLLKLVRAEKIASTLLDAAAPGAAFIIAMVRFSHIFTNACRGKIVVENEALCHLPLASAVTFGDGKTSYQFASFFISFILMLAVTAVLLFFKSGQAGETFRLFLLLFSVEEVFIDSTRNDASHLFFSGESLQGLNKGASFMGLSQFISALILGYLFIFYLVNYSKKMKTEPALKKPVLPILLFAFGLLVAGGCEYLVQRFTSLYFPIYAGQIIGLIMMGTSIRLMSSKISSSKLS